jgi:hypothetical protein
LPAGLLAQPFYGWSITRNEFAQPASAGLLIGGFSQMHKRLKVSTLKRANVITPDDHPALKALVW